MHGQLFSMGKNTLVSVESVRVFDSRIMFDVQTFIGQCEGITIH